MRISATLLGAPFLVNMRFKGSSADPVFFDLWVYGENETSETVTRGPGSDGTVGKYS